MPSWKSTYNPFGPEPVDAQAAELMATVIPLMRTAMESANIPSISPASMTYQRALAEGNGRTHVYLYTLADANQPAAYKRLVTRHPDLATNAMMLVREAILLHRLHHDNIVRVLGMVYEDATAGMLTEYLEGSTLRTILLEAMATVQRDRYTLQQGLQWCLDVARALAYCHDECGVLHRDVNPFNIVVTLAGSAKVVDFGFHKLVGTTQDTPQLLTSPVGALMFCAPEVWRGQPYGRPADVFAFACTMYEVLAGTVRSAALFPDTATQKDLAGYAERVAGGYREKQPVAVGGGAVPVVVWGLVEACWAPDPAKRPSMRSVVHVLEQQQLSSSDDGTTPPRVDMYQCTVS